LPYPKVPLAVQTGFRKRTPAISVSICGMNCSPVDAWLSSGDDCRLAGGPWLARSPCVRVLAFAHISTFSTGCHSERSEESRPVCEGANQSEIPRSARNDSYSRLSRASRLSTFDSRLLDSSGPPANVPNYSVRPEHRSLGADSLISLMTSALDADAASQANAQATSHAVFHRNQARVAILSCQLH